MASVGCPKHLVFDRKILDAFILYPSCIFSKFTVLNYINILDTEWWSNDRTIIIICRRFVSNVIFGYYANSVEMQALNLHLNEMRARMNCNEWTKKWIKQKREASIMAKGRQTNRKSEGLRAYVVRCNDFEMLLYPIIMVKSHRKNESKSNVNL